MKKIKINSFKFFAIVLITSTIWAVLLNVLITSYLIYLVSCIVAGVCNGILIAEFTEPQ